MDVDDGWVFHRKRHELDSFSSLLKKALYRKSFEELLLRCLDSEVGSYVMRELHEGIARAPEGARAMVKNALRQGYYRPSMLQDAVKSTKVCDSSDRSLEAEAVFAITDRMVKKLLWKHIICRFGIPRILVFNNGTQFTNNLMVELELAEEKRLLAKKRMARTKLAPARIFNWKVKAKQFYIGELIVWYVDVASLQR
ncbi:hypothetical protein CRG98_001457 [Punica granatum]|uniref:Integrase catalytic domain-containing protein n=1 Tax=Punica granatum TaxID=22663 RepID=A0A2I0LBR8_PUNGR|nr:hypothetical protein CRG98_001457 [Punica granatum]